MNLLLWSGLFCFSLTWLFVLNIYSTERDAWWIALLVAGCLCNALALKGKTQFRHTDNKKYFLLLPLVVSLFNLPFPYHLGIILVIAGLLLLFLCPVLSFLSAPASGLILSGVILMIQSPVGFLYTVFTSYSHNFFWLDSIFYRLFTLLNLKVSYSQHVF